MGRRSRRREVQFRTAPISEDLRRRATERAHVVLAESFDLGRVTVETSADFYDLVRIIANAAIDQVEEESPMFKYLTHCAHCDMWATWVASERDQRNEPIACCAFCREPLGEEAE